MPTINLLHLSDLHFVEDKGGTARAERDSALDGLVDTLSNLESAWKPHLIAISGDLSYQGDPKGYDALTVWLKTKLFPATKLGPADCIICPGNHDLSRKKAKSLLDRTGDATRADEVLRPEDLEEGFARPFAAYSKFAADLQIPPVDLTAFGPNHLSGTRETHGLRLVVLNSAWFCRDSKTDNSNLWLGLPQLHCIFHGVKTGDYNHGPLTIALLHHPSDWLAKPELTAWDNRPAAYEFLANRAHIMLSGHTHGALERPTQWYKRAHLFRSGAGYDNHQYRNTFAILQIDTDSNVRAVTNRPWEFDPRNSKWEEKSGETYDLKIPKPGISPRGYDTTKYFTWLRGETQSLNLHQLKVGPGDTPPPAIDTLYIRLRARTSGSMESRLHESIDLEQSLHHRKLVIEGKPGGGKTTFVRWLAWNLCRPGGPPPNFPIQTSFPIFIRISQLDQHIANTIAAKEPGAPKTATDAAWLPHYLASQPWGLDADFFKDKLDANAETVLLLDGLDEAANQTRRERIVELIQNAARDLPGRVVVTTRPNVHEGRSTLQGFEPAFIDDLDPEGIEGFLRQWCLWLKRGDTAAAEDYLTELRPAVAVPSIRLLAKNPLMLTALAALHLRRHRLPEQRAQLYEQIMDWLGDQAETRHPDRWKKDDLLNQLGELALAMQEWQGGQKLQIGIDTAAAKLSGQTIESARRFLELAQVDSGIVTLRGGELAFWHRSFQEYLAARKLSGFPDQKLQQGAVKLLYTAEGREVLPLLGGRMAESARERLNDLLEALTKHAIAQKTLDRQAHAAGVLGNLFADLAPTTYKPSQNAATQYEALRQPVMAIFKKGGARNIGLKTRIAAAEALDQASQSRLHQPDHKDYWVQVPEGDYPLGGDKNNNELRAQKVNLKTFRLGRFPVTVWEFDRYVNEENLEPRKEWKWDEQLLHLSRPVVYVSHAEAQRYCQWANGKWKRPCFLPSEHQWEAAARGLEGRHYPWGPKDKAPDEYLANFGNPSGAPTPVGMFPDGDTPGEPGISDMAGNVWEWTCSDYDDEKKYKTVRGASFLSDSSILRAAFRGWVVPGNRFDFLGFRCAGE